MQNIIHFKQLPMQQKITDPVRCLSSIYRIGVTIGVTNAAIATDPSFLLFNLSATLTSA